MNEIEKLELLLKADGLTIGGITLGDTPSSSEEIAKAIRKSLIALRRGELETIKPNRESKLKCYQN